MKLQKIDLISNKKKKVLFIVEAMGGGVFSYIVDLANKLAGSMNVYIAYGIRKETPLNYIEYFDKRIKLIKIDNFTREINFNKDIKSFFEIKRVAEEINPDIIHLHSSKAGVLGRLAFNNKKSTLFYTPHGYSFLMESSGLIKRKIYYIIEAILAKKNCKTVSCSKGEYLETEKFNKNAAYVNNGIDIKKLQTIINKNKNKNKNDVFTVFTIGRICHQKNPELFNMIAERLPHIKFVWIGDGELKEKLTSDNITITGWMNRDDVIKKALSADAFILTSLWEGLPISLLEAMYMKKVCIVNNVIGNKDVINHGINGYVCSNVDEFVESLNLVIKNNHEHMVNQSYNDVLMYYNTDIMLEEYIKIYGG